MNTITQASLTQVSIQFPELHLQTRDAHKLRGYFGRLFQEHSPLLHNHYNTGELRHHYPLVQYKVLNGTPTLVALEEGAELLTKLFLKIDRLEIDGTTYPVNSKNIENRNIAIGYSDQLQEYRFETLWMGLNQNNYQKYRQASREDKQNLLNRVLVGNVLSFFKNVGVRLQENERLMVKPQLQEKTTRFKNQKMMGFAGSFIINAQLPPMVGIGKAVSRGYGTINPQ